MKRREQMESKVSSLIKGDVTGNVTRELIKLIEQEGPVRNRMPFPQTGSNESFRILITSDFIRFASNSGIFQADIFNTAKDIINYLNLEIEQVPAMLEDGLRLILQNGTAIIFDVECTGQALPFYPDQLMRAATEYLSVHQPEQTPVKLLVTDWKKLDRNGLPNENYTTYDNKIKQHGENFSWLSPAQRQANAVFSTANGKQAHLLGFTDAHIVTLEDRTIAFFMKPEPQK